MLRNIGFGFLAIVVFQAFVVLGDMGSFSFFTMPAGMDTGSMDSVKQHMHEIPLGCFLVMMAGHLMGSLAAGWIVARFTGNASTALVVGVLITLGGVANLFLVPHPSWFWADALLYPMGVWLGYRNGLRR